MILLTPTQANRIRGLTTRGHALAPVPLADGNYALPDSVLTDPAHQKYRAGLSALPRVPDDSLRLGEPQDRSNPTSPLINSDYEQDPVKRSRAAYSPDWQPGVNVTVD